MGEEVEPVIHCHAMLMTPTCLLPSMPQAMAVRIGGMKKGRVISTSSVPRAGVSVRAQIHASSTASPIEGTVLASESPIVLTRMMMFSWVRISR